MKHIIQIPMFMHCTCDATNAKNYRNIYRTKVLCDIKQIHVNSPLFSLNFDSQNSHFFHFNNNKRVGVEWAWAWNDIILTLGIGIYSGVSAIIINPYWNVFVVFKIVVFYKVTKCFTLICQLSRGNIYHFQIYAYQLKQTCKHT